MSLPPSTLGYWVKLYKAGKLGDVGKSYRPLTDVEMELARTKKELAEVKMERDILKKAAAYFARESQPGTAMMKQLRLESRSVRPVRVSAVATRLGGQAAEQASARGCAAGA